MPAAARAGELLMAYELVERESAKRVFCVSEEGHNQPEPIFPPKDSPVRPLTNEEIERLELRLGRPVDRDYLVSWVSQAIRDVVRLSQQPTARELRDGLQEIAKKGRRWIRDVEACPGVSRVGRTLEELKRTTATFCDQADRLAKEFDAAVKRGRRPTPFALEAFLSRMLGIAKTAKVYPSAESRALRSQTAPREPPAFFGFVAEALKIAQDVIQSSPVTDEQKDASLSTLWVPNNAVLSRLIVQVRGKISDYREAPHGLVTWANPQND